jgi:hypothetical protein
MEEQLNILLSKMDTLQNELTELKFINLQNTNNLNNHINFVTNIYNMIKFPFQKILQLFDNNTIELPLSEPKQLIF